MRERVQLCKLLAREVSPWRPFSVDVYGNVHFRKVVAQQQRDQTRPAEKFRFNVCPPAEQAGRPTRRVSPSRARRSADRAATRAAAEAAKKNKEEGKGPAIDTWCARTHAWKLSIAEGELEALNEMSALAGVSARHAAQSNKEEEMPSFEQLRCIWYPPRAAAGRVAASAMEVGAAEGGAGSQEPVQAVAASVATGADGMVKKRRLGVAAVPRVPIAAGAIQASPPSEAWGRLGPPADEAVRARMTKESMEWRPSRGTRSTNATTHEASPASDEWPSPSV